MSLSWLVETVTGPAASLHDGSAAVLQGPGLLSPTVRVLSAVDVALVLGSSQPESDVDRLRAAAAHVSVVRRRSGGGAVLVGPGLVVWVDVVIPAAGPLWDWDLRRASVWLGSAWAAALADVGVADGEVHRGGLVRGDWSDRVCFAGLGPGEVIIGGTKIVGMSQRRTKRGVLFQCAVPVVWEPAALLDLLALDDETRRRGDVELAGVASGVGADCGRRLVAALLDRLP